MCLYKRKQHNNLIRAYLAAKAQAGWNVGLIFKN